MMRIRYSPVSIAGVALAVCLAAWAGSAAVADAGHPAGIDLTEGKPALAKVSSHLLRARALAAAGRSADEIATAVPGARLRDGAAEVEIRLERLTPALLEALRERGLEVRSHHLGYARAYGRLDPADLDEIAALSEVSTIEPMPVSATRVGAATNQADDTMRAVNVRVFHNADGSFVTAGILSDSFNAARGGTVSGGGCDCSTPGSFCATVVNGMADQASGDLPPNIPILDDCTAGSPACDALVDEGAALGELMYDLAPGATLMFHSALNDPADFAAGITELRNCGADLLVDDAQWTGQAFFQDDIIAQAARDATAAGVPYVSAAGNNATFGVLDTYTDSNAGVDDACPAAKLLPDGDDLHEFAAGDAFGAITVPGGCSIRAELQWNEPFDGTLGPGASSDLDLFLLSSAVAPAAGGGGNVLDSSTTAQGCGVDGGPGTGGNPLEFVSHTNEAGSPETVFLAVEHCCGDEGVEMRIVNLSLDCELTEAGWDFEDGESGESSIFVDAQVFGHPAAPGVVAVAAAFYAEIDGGGSVQPPFGGQLDVEPSSSLGGDLSIYFSDDGTPLPAPETRTVPRVTGADGTNTTFLGLDGTFDPDTDPNLFGTSAAAANVAGVAALLLDATEKLINPEPLAQLMEQASREMETAGPDELSGHGFLDALNAVRSLLATTAPLIDALEFDLDGGDFLRMSPPALQRVQAVDSLTVGDGRYDGVEGKADAIIFTDGFESGDTSTWRN